jgi:hypothetical protein
LNAVRCFLKGYLSRIVWANNHLQVVIIVDTIPRQYKIQSPTWSSPSWLSRTVSCGSHATTQPFPMKTPLSPKISHLIPCHSNLCFLTTLEFLSLKLSPYFASSCRHPLACSFPFSCCS